jgi:prophage regulatory protein
MRQNEEFGVEKELRKSSKVLISKKQLLAMIPLCERTIYNFEKQGKFPRRIAVSSRKVVWDLEEVETWIDTCRHSGQALRPGIGA